MQQRKGRGGVGWGGVGGRIRGGGKREDTLRRWHRSHAPQAAARRAPTRHRACGIILIFRVHIFSIIRHLLGLGVQNCENEKCATNDRVWPSSSLFAPFAPILHTFFEGPRPQLVSDSSERKSSRRMSRTPFIDCATLHGACSKILPFRDLARRPRLLILSQQSSPHPPTDSRSQQALAVLLARYFAVDRSRSSSDAPLAAEEAMRCAHLIASGVAGSKALASLSTPDSALMLGDDGWGAARACTPSLRDMDAAAGARWRGKMAAAHAGALALKAGGVPCGGRDSYGAIATRATPMPTRKESVRHVTTAWGRRTGRGARQGAPPPVLSPGDSPVEAAVKTRRFWRYGDYLTGTPGSE